MKKFQKLVPANKEDIENAEEALESYGKLVFFDKEVEKNMDPQARRYLEQMMEAKVREEMSIYVIYRPECGCPIDQTVLLDRFPMSPKIHTTCPMCNKGILTAISDPIIFHCPWDGKDLTLEELSKGKITSGTQKPLLDAYCFHWTMGTLEELLRSEDKNDSEGKGKNKKSKREVASKGKAKKTKRKG